MTERPSLGDTTTSGPPSIKLGTVGAHFTLGVVNVDKYQQRTYDPTGPGEPKTFADGKPMMGTVVTGIVVDADGCHTGAESDPQPVAVGDTVSIFVEGSRWFAYRDGLKAFLESTRKGQVQCGDVMRWDRLADEPTKGYPKKNYAVRFREPEARDGDLVERCVQAYKAHQQRPAVGDVPAASMSSWSDEEPF